MSPEICPSLFNIVPDIKTKPNNERDLFMSDRFKVLQAESLTRIKYIVAQTSTDQPLQVRLLCCYRMKDLSEAYCTFRQVNHPKKQVCSEKTGIKNDFIHFHIHGKVKNLRCSEYLLAFIEGSDLSNNVESLVNELLSSVTWLEIGDSEVFLNVFTFGQPVFGTRNLSHQLEELINSMQIQTTSKYKGIIYNITITHINKDQENLLSVSLRDRYLFFTPS